ncbi:MAG: sensor histidine kinase [Planctomycetota bacterium]
MTTFLTWAFAALAAIFILAWSRERSLRGQELRRLRELGEKREAMRRCLEFLSEGVVLLGPRDEVLYVNPAALGLLASDYRPQGGARPPLADLSSAPELLSFVAETEPSASRRQVIEIDRGEEQRDATLELTLAEAGMARRLLVLRDVKADEQVDRKRQDFVANASHELKTPIAALIGLLDLVDLVPEEKRAELMERARRNAHGLANMTEDLLALARAEAGDWQPSPRQVDLDQEVDRVLEPLREAANAKGLKLKAQLSPRSREIWLDPFALRTILQNLVGNGITYTEAGQVTLVADVTPDDTRLLLEVSDTGPGIDPEIQPRIFERFFRGDVAHSREVGGTGLGLSIVRHLVRRVGGRLSLHSVPGEGSTFRVELPCRAA